MEGSFETSYLLSPQQFDGVEGRNGKTATPPSDLPQTSVLNLARARPARGAEERVRLRQSTERTSAGRASAKVHCALALQTSVFDDAKATSVR